MRIELVKKMGNSELLIFANKPQSSLAKRWQTGRADRHIGTRGSVDASVWQPRNDRLNVVERLV